PPSLSVGTDVRVCQPFKPLLRRFGALPGSRWAFRRNLLGALLQLIAPFGAQLSGVFNRVCGAGLPPSPALYGRHPDLLVHVVAFRTKIIYHEATNGSRKKFALRTFAPSWFRCQTKRPRPSSAAGGCFVRFVVLVYLLENWNRRRAPRWPYFLRSFM